MIELKSYLCDRWRSGNGTPTVLVNPATEESIAQVRSGGLDREAAVRHAREIGGPALRAMTFAERGRLLKSMSNVLHEARDELIAASIENGGTTRSDAKFDIDGATGTLAYYASLGESLGNQRILLDGSSEQLTRSARFFGYHVRTPRRGVAVHINAFNFPAWGLAEKAAVALLAGIPVLTKPGTATALLAYRCAEKLVQAEILPAGAFSFLCGSSGDLVSHLRGQDVLSFTGSGSTGAHLRALESVVHRAVRINVEADSLNAAILCSDVEAGSDTYGMFLRDVVKEITQKTGQKCTAVRRVFVPDAMIDQVQRDLGEALSLVTVGDPARDDVRMGPLASAQQLSDVRAGLARLQKSGARIVVGQPGECQTLGVNPGKGFFFAPLLLRHDDPHRAGDVHGHEVFGPVATLMPYQDVREAAQLVALGEGGLMACVYGDDKRLLGELTLELAPFHGRILLGSRKVADQSIPPGTVLPSCVHGGPGRAGGGEELGGVRGLDVYMQRTAIQGDRALIDRMLERRSV